MSVSAQAQPRRRGRAFTVTAVAVFAVLSAVALAAVWHGFGPKVIVAPDFTLHDQTGRPFTLSALRGHPVLLFFGYTHCPDVCPTTLAHAARALRAPDAPRDARVAFVTVDPRRDTPAALRNYVRLFDPHVIGLTGNERELAPVYSAYHLWRQIGPAQHGSDYAVSHSTTLYYVGRDGALNGFGQWDDDSAEIARDLARFQ